ncbi:unnamed protein product [Miscanthus lutarioriparius]|uniref:Uncharacterized protein n=1 Tax=Miscanthus lutarioriparius TaxID=422564 RepID=A0A811QYK2_9POAL|nr:unnamed protein product [Miscanthus lutarioriparius]
MPDPTTGGAGRTRPTRRTRGGCGARRLVSVLRARCRRRPRTQVQPHAGEFAVCLEMLPWAATASPPRTPAAASFVPPLRAAAARPPPPLRRPLLRLLRAGLNSPLRAPCSDGDVFCEEPDNGSGCDYEDDGPEQRRASRFSSPSSSSRLEAAAQQEQASGEVCVEENTSCKRKWKLQMALIARLQHPYIVEFKEAWVEKR